MFYFNDPYLILLILAMVLAMFAQASVTSNFNKYLKVKSKKGLTGEQAARRVLDANGMQNMPIEMVHGSLTDHYDPRKKVMRLSAEVYQGTSVASVAVAAHEAGHAIQHNSGYAFLKVRNSLAPLVSVVSNLAWPLALFGLFFGALGLFDLGIIFYAAAVAFQLITLPVEFNASNRAIAQLEGLGLIFEDEKGMAKKVLSAAALTYVAATAVAVINLLRLIAMRGNR